MSTFNYSGVFQHASGKFWHIYNPQEVGGDLVFQPNRRCCIVGVFDPKKKDFRVKNFLATKTDSEHVFLVNGHVCPGEFAKAPGMYECKIDSSSKMWDILHGASPADRIEDEGEAPDQSLDCCIETVFNREVRSGRYGMHPGDASNFPEWMKATSISVSTTDCGGSGPWVHLKTAHNNPYSSILQAFLTFRINGVWMYGTPISRKGGWNGEFMYVGLPHDIAEIRTYGDGLVDIHLEDELVPPRNYRAIRNIANFLKNDARDKGILKDYRPWANAAANLIAKIHGAAICYGQAAVYCRHAEDCQQRADHYWRAFSRAYERRVKAYKDYTSRQWAEEVRGKPLEWLNKHETFNAAYEKNEEKRMEYRERHDTCCDEAEKCLEILEAMEGKYASVIAMFQPEAP